MPQFPWKFSKKGQKTENGQQPLSPVQIIYWLCCILATDGSKATQNRSKQGRKMKNCRTPGTPSPICENFSNSFIILTRISSVSQIDSIYCLQIQSFFLRFQFFGPLILSYSYLKIVKMKECTWPFPWFPVRIHPKVDAKLLNKEGLWLARVTLQKYPRRTSSTQCRVKLLTIWLRCLESRRICLLYRDMWP